MALDIYNNTTKPPDQNLKPLAVATPKTNVTPTTSNKAIYEPRPTYETPTNERRVGTDPEGGYKTTTDTVPAPNREYEVRFIKQEDLEGLGLDESYLGLPLDIGYKDAGGGWVTTASKLDLARQMHDLRTLERPEMADLTTSDAYTNLQNLTEQLRTGELVAQDQAEGQAYFEEMMGFSPGGMTDRLSSMEGLMGQGIQGQQGLSDEQTDLYNRQTQIQLQQMRSDSAQLMESLGASGRSVAGFQAMLDLSRNQADFQAGRDLELLTQDTMMKQAEYQALSNRYEQLFNMGQITIGQYSSALRENRMAAIQGYAQQITTMAQNNQQNLQAYETHAQVMYNNVMADLGVSQGLLNEAAAHYEQYMAPITAEREAQALEDEKAAAEAKQNTDNLSGMFAMVGSGAMTGGAVGGPLGAAIGGGIGLIVGGINWLLGL